MQRMASNVAASGGDHPAWPAAESRRSRSKAALMSARCVNAWGGQPGAAFTVSRGRGVQALAPTSMLAGKHLPDPPRRDPARAPARYRLEQPMDRLHHHDLTIRNCRAGAQGPPLNNENAVNARKLMVLTAFGGSERSRVCRHLGTCAGVSAVSERP